MTEPTSEPLRDIVYTASVRRAHHAHRLALVGRSREELYASLEAFGRGELLAGVTRGEAPAEVQPKVVFVYPGQGSQWVGMGRQLLAEEPVFRRAMEACDAAIQREGGFSVLDELCADESKSKLAQFDIVQPMLFAIEVALTALWRSWGVEPDAVVGHSMGEVAAAHVAGALSLEDAAAVVCRRSRILRKVSGEGVMAWCELSMEQAEAALRDYASRLSIAASNGPRSTVVSGEPGALDEMLAKLAKEDVFFRRVKVSDVASHSPKMEPLLGEVMAALSTIAPRASHVPMYSTVTGTLIAGEALGAAYWVRNLRDRVLFSQGIERLLEEGHTVFVEMSPHPSLLPSIEERGRQDGGKTVLISSLRRGREGRRELLSSLGALYAHGYPVAFPKLYPSGGRCVSLPTYPWQRERHWIEASGPTNGVAEPAGARRGGGPSHPLLGSSFTIATQEGQRFWEKELSVEVLPYLADHRVEGDVVLPGAAYVEMALSAAIEAYGHEAYVVEDIAFERMLALPPHGVRIVQTTLSEQNEGYASLQISSRMPTDKTWVRHATAGLRKGERAAPPTQGNEALSAIQARCPTPMSAAEYYPRVQERGVEFGPSFRGIERLWIGTGEVIGRVRLPEEGVEEASAYQLHPALLDACFQVLGGLWLDQESAAGKEKVHVSVGVERTRFEGRPGPALWVHGRLREAEGNGEEGFTADLRLLDDDGHVVGEAVGLRVKPLSPSAKALREPYETWLHALSWRRKDHDAEVSGSPTSPAAGAFLLWMDRGETGTALSKLLNERGEACVRVVAGERYARLDEGLYQVNPSDPEGYRAVLHEAFSKERPCRGVVHLWSLDATATADTSAEALLSAQRQSSVSALYLAQALLREGFRDLPRLVLVTRGAQAVATERHAVQVAQAPLWGLGRTLGMEHPELGCTLLDLSPRPEAGEAFSLWRELLASDGEDQVALREGVRHVARLVRSTLRTHDAPRLGADKSYLISGGLGGLGLSVAAWMVREGARHLTLVGRSRPSAAAQAALAALEEAGAKVRVVAADVSRRVEVERVLMEIEQNSPPLGGVVHAAVVLEDRSALELSGESFDKVMAPKMQGAWNLHVLTRDTPLDFFVLYSSAASLLGLPGQSNDAAANAFLDALAHHRQNLGLSALSINWGAFSQVGLAATQENRGERLSSRGIRSLSPAQGVDVLQRLLGGAHAQIGVLDLNLRQWIQFYPSAARMPVFSELLRESRQEKPGAGEASRFRETLAKAAPGDRATLLEQHVGEELGQILRLPAARIERKASFSRLGVDSLMSLELRNRLEVSLGLKLSATLLFTYTNLATMAEHLLDKMNLREGAENGASSRHVEDEAPIDNAAAADIKELSDDDLLAAFDLSLNRIKTENLQ
ncbi:MAG TPA: SDR family NAD(P)-dependent oxidoreductase [Polyangium sp.]|nr:SDR family NAD(P)-dependent oxidoreductase [Polyangium sp.]